jgi:uncharacterized membrane protein YedE/YeeE
MTLVVAFASGLLFAVGLVLSGMTVPARILDFLDVAGAWDPTLMFVMIGAIATFAPLYRLSNRRGRPKLAASFQVPTNRGIDRRLVVGAALFGIGWGLSGFCPGPAVVSAGTLAPQPILFVLAMLAGMLSFRWLERQKGEPLSEHELPSGGQNAH